MKKVKVNKELCVRCNSCVCSAPDVFANDEEGFSKVINPIVEDDNEDVLIAAEVCPTEAITLEDVKESEEE